MFNKNYYDTLAGKIGDLYNFSSFDFDAKLVDFIPKVLDFHTSTNQGKGIRKIDAIFGPQEGTTTFQKTYQDPKYACFTKEETKAPGDLLKKDYLEINAR